MDINQVTLVGRLSKEPEVRSIRDNLYLNKFSICVSDRNYKTNEKTVGFYETVAWSTTEDRYSNLKKGSTVIMTGRLKMEKWTDKEGRARKMISVLCDNVLAAERSPQAQIMPDEPKAKPEEKEKKRLNDIPEENADLFASGLPF